MNLKKYNRLSGNTGVDDDDSQKDLKIISDMTRKEIEKSFCDKLNRFPRSLVAI